jgi:hypothetical protein
MKCSPDQEDEHHIDHADQQDHQSEAECEQGQNPVGAQDLEAAPDSGRAPVRRQSRRPSSGAKQHRRAGQHGEGCRVNGQRGPASECPGKQAADSRRAHENEGVQRLLG